MNEAIELATREGASLILALIVPALLLGLAAAIVAGWVGAALGIRDAALSQSIRALAVVLALGLLAEPIAAATTAFARARWASLADLHESGEEPEP